jgi:hypothetical protein
MAILLRAAALSERQLARSLSSHTHSVPHKLSKEQVAEKLPRHWHQVSVGRLQGLRALHGVAPRSTTTRSSASSSLATFGKPLRS